MAEAYNKVDPKETKEATADEVGVKATDDNTLVVTLERPYSLFLRINSIHHLFPSKSKDC